MARKSSSLFSMAILAVGGYFLYENWPMVSAWFGSMVPTPAPAPAAAVPASAGTLVSTAAPVVQTSTQPASAPPALPASPGTVIPTATMAPGASTPTYVFMQPTPMSRVSPVQETIAAAPPAGKDTAAIQAQIKDLQDELRFETNANGYTTEDRADIREQIAVLQSQL